MLSLITFDQNDNETQITSQEQLDKLSSNDTLIFYEEDDIILNFNEDAERISKYTTLTPKQLAKYILSIASQYQWLNEFYLDNQVVLTNGPVYVNRSDSAELRDFLETYDIDPVDIIATSSDRSYADINLNRDFLIWQKDSIYTESFIRVEDLLKLIDALSERD